MSVNRYAPHVVIIPEDDANRQIINGFLLNHSVDTRKIHVEREAGGWLEALALFRKVHAPAMDKWEHRFVILAIDFDEDANRLAEVQKLIPEHLRDRVFILGTLSEPERLKAHLGASFEHIGERLAAECKTHDGIWANELLVHNAMEIERLRVAVCGFVFSSWPEAA